MEIIRENNNAWIINKHINDINLLILYAKILKKDNSLSQESVEEFTTYLKSIGQYNPRWNDRTINLSTAMNKVSELCFYMFGYKHNNQFIFSPLGNLFLEQESNSTNKMFVFTSMLWGMQFNHPHNSTPDLFNLYPLRLVFRLLIDDRIDKKLYTSEILYFLYFIKEIDDSSFEQLVDEILAFRRISKEDKIELMLNTPVGTLSNINKFGYEKATETWWANKIHEWDYYFRKVLEQINIFQSFNDEDLIARFEQGSSSPPTMRSLKNNYIKLNSNLAEYIKLLNDKYPFTDSPVKKDNYLESEFKADIYNFLPEILFDFIDVKPKNYKEILVVNKIYEKSINRVSDNIVSYSTQGEKHKEFEIALEEGFNSFSDIKAERVGGAGKTDVECIYLKIERTFAVEAKATKNTFGTLQTRRLKEHREGINACTLF